VLAALARFTIRRRRILVGAWIVLTILGGIAAGRLSGRWYQSFSIPGFSAYEANQRTLKTFGSGEQAPLVAVFTTPGKDVTTVPGIQRSIEAGVKQIKGPARVGSWFEDKSDAYLSKDRHTMVATLYPPGNATFSTQPPIDQVRAALKRTAPAGVEVHLTGRDAVFKSQGAAGGPGVLTETLIGGAGALIVLLFVFGTLPAVAMPIAVAVSSILTTFLCVYGLTYVTNVSIIVQFLVALVGLGVAIDYALLVVFRFREELTLHETTEEALVETMTHAGRSVIVSGSTVAIGLLSMLVIPLPFIRSIGLGGMLIPAVSVLSSITLLPAMLAMLGPKLNRVRVMPKRFVEPHPAETGLWWRWSRTVMRHSVLVFAAGVAIVTLVLIPAFQINPSDAELAKEPAKGDANAGRAAVSSAGFPSGVYLPYIVLVEHGATPQVLRTVAKDLAADSDIAGVSAPPQWRKDGTGLVEAFGVDDANSRPAKKTISRLQDEVLPRIESRFGGDTRLTLAGVGPEARDFVHAVYGKFPYVVLFVLILTYVLLTRAFRSIVLPLKAVLLNLVSLGAAYGIVVFIFQQGHGSDAIWGVQATDAIISWIPLMIFAFLYGISMDYEVFMLSRIREEYDETHDTPYAIAHGLARTGKLVTSAALVLMLAFFSLSTGPGPDIKQFAIGLAAGIIFDATVIRALLVPATMQLLGRWNWVFPRPVARLLRVAPGEPVTGEAAPG
jgi:putative drug exporter of the RND superfamily